MIDYVYRPYEETLDQFWQRIDQAEKALTVARIHRENPGTERSAELDILALTEFGWLS